MGVVEPRRSRVICQRGVSDSRRVSDGARETLEGRGMLCTTYGAWWGWSLLSVQSKLDSVGLLNLVLVPIGPFLEGPDSHLLRCACSSIRRRSDAG